MKTYQPFQFLDLDGKVSYFQLPELEKLGSGSNSPSKPKEKSSGGSFTDMQLGTQSISSMSEQNGHLETVTINLASLLRSTAGGATNNLTVKEPDVERTTNFTDSIEECVFSEQTSQTGTQSGLKRRSMTPNEKMTFDESPSKSRRSS